MLKSVNKCLSEHQTHEKNPQGIQILQRNVCKMMHKTFKIMLQPYNCALGFSPSLSVNERSFSVSINLLVVIDFVL